MRNDTGEWKELAAVSESEFARFQAFLASHETTEIEVDGRSIEYSISGEGARCALLLAGGWGGPELAYESILGLEDMCRVLVVDVSGFGDPAGLLRAVHRVLDKVGIRRAVLIGQSMSGILAQVLLRQDSSRIDGMVLINTIAPRKKRCRKWALPLIKVMPLSIFKRLAKKSLSKLGKYQADVSPEIEERLKFKAAFVSHAFTRSATKAKLLNVLKQAYQLNLMDGYTQREVENWNGRLHIISSEDDPYFADIELFRDAFPDLTLTLLPTGYGHIAPQVFREEFFQDIRDFIRRLED